MAMNKAELKKAYEQGLIDIEKYKEELFNLEIAPKPKKKQTRIYEAVPQDVFIKILKSAKKMHHKICLILAYGSGLRISEIPVLQKDDFDFKKKSIFIRQAKGSKDRETIMFPIKSPYFKQDYLRKIPIKIKGKQITTRAISKMFLQLSEPYNKVLYTDALGRPRYRYHFHSLRHSFAVNCLEAGYPPNYVQALLGHEDLKTTSKYTRISSADAVNMAISRGL